MIVSDSFPNLINGVSQQAEALRLNSQVEALQNAVCSVVDGLHKRQPTKNIAKLLTGSHVNAYTKTINRDTTEQYQLILENGSIHVFDLAGNAMTVNTPDGTAYLTVAGLPYQSFRTVTIADTTFIVNREKTVAMSNSTTAAKLPAALIWIRQGLIGHDYKVEIDGSTVATFNNSTSTTVVLTTDIAASLYASIVAALSVTFDITLSENLIYLKRKNGADFQIKVYDSYGNQATALIKDQVQKFSDLPAKAYPGMILEVQSDPGSDSDGYWVEFIPDTATVFGRGSWQETIGPSMKYTFDKTTMPFILQRTALNTFTLKKGTWSDRTVGDDTSAPQPSFVGNTVNDVFVYRGRLGFLASENVIFTQAAEFFNFWPTTVTTLLDDARIDYRVGGTAVAVLYHAIPFRDSLLLFSDQSQITLSQGDILTQKTVSTTVTTVFDGLIHAQPVNSGNSVFFGFRRGSYSGVREYFVENQVIGVNDAADITAHVPKYIAHDIVGISVGTALSASIVRTEAGNNALYLYQWLWAQNQKVQSAWNKWTFDGDPIGAEFIGDVLYLVMQRTSGIWLEKLELAKKVDDGLNYMLCLDRRVTATFVSYSIATNRSTFTLPYYSADVQMVHDAVKLQLVSNTDNTTSSTVVVSGNYSTGVTAGVPYNFSVTFTRPFLKTNAQSGGYVAINDGRLQVSYFSIRYADTGFFELSVKPDLYNTYTYDFTGRVIGSDHNIIGTPAIESGTLKVPIRSSNERMVLTVSNNTFMPCFLLSAEWMGNYNPKSRRAS